MLSIATYEPPSAPSQLQIPGSLRRSEARLLLDVLCSLHGASRRRSPDAGALVSCVVQAQAHVGLSESALPAPGRQDGEAPVTTAEWARLGRGLQAARRRCASGAAYLDHWLPRLARTVGLNVTETAILGLALGYKLDRHLERLWDNLSDNRGRGPFLHDDPDLFAVLLGKQEAVIRPCLAPDARLRASGLLAVDEDGDIDLLPRLSSLLARRVPVADDVRSLLLSPPRQAELPWSAFQHLGEAAETAARVLGAALKAREPGVGILLYGPPGTGKTAFAAALAEHVGAALHPVGEADSVGDEPSRSERLADLRLNQRLLGDAASVLLFDEAEDLFPSYLFGEENRVRSRVFVHRLLEHGRAPVIWTANDVGALGPAVVRRMLLCIEMRQPGVAVRTSLWQDLARSEGIMLAKADANHLARVVPAAPAILRNSLRATRLAGGDSATARMIATGIARAVEGGRLPAPAPAADPDYDSSLVLADCDLVALTAQLARPGAPHAVSLLLSGPPGSGKSAYARHLATAIGLPVLQKRASDLLGPYVGQSEQQIAAAFAEACDTNAFLIFDEADSLLGDRRDAHRSWEISQVNEMLTWMEQHPLPFACTTNLVDRLDPASLRRFLVKVRFGYLNMAQANAAFVRFFGMAPPAGLGQVERLTPADFALVRRRIPLLGAAPRPEALVTLLAAESAERSSRRRIGFFASGIQ